MIYPTIATFSKLVHQNPQIHHSVLSLRYTHACTYCQIDSASGFKLSSSLNCIPYVATFRKTRLLKPNYFNLFTSQSKPSCKPTPVFAWQDWTYHGRSPSANDLKYTISVNWLALTAFGRSCLFANTNRGTFSNSGAWEIASTSFLANSNRFVSLLSTTKILLVCEYQ